MAVAARRGRSSSPEMSLQQREGTLRVRSQSPAMALIQAQHNPTHSGIYLPERKKTAEPHSYTDRSIRIYLEESGESMTIGAKTSTQVQEVKDLLGTVGQIEPGKLIVKRKTVSGSAIMKDCEEVSSTVIVAGLGSFKRKQKRYEHPIFVLGAGLGGMQSMIALLEKGHKDLVCMEKHEDFGGHSWITVANRFTKLQTEKGTYHVDYIDPAKPVPARIGGRDYCTWPSRDLLLHMFRENAREHGLYDYTIFGQELVKTTPKKDAYVVQHVPVNPDEDSGVLVAGAMVSWPGNLIVMNLLEFPGEDDFDGYIEYSSFDKVDYKQAERKNVILYGHGAFTIENVRTLVEHKCKKVYVLCRKRNLCGMKMASWMVGQSEIPVAGHIMLDVFQRMYDLVGFDVWTAHSIQTDEKRSFAQVSQKTVFGVTDIYFLSGYYGLMEVVVDEIKRLTHHCAHTKKMRKIECEMIVKAIGTAPSFHIDKVLGIKKLVGFWINGDPLRSVACNGMFVQARNFGSFSSGPGFTPIIKMMAWFIDYPDDWALVSKMLPQNHPSDRPAYVPDASFFLPLFMAVNSTLPMLAQETSLMDAQKAKKQRQAHPLETFLPECEAEWKAYISFFKKEDMVDDRPEPPYPYTIPMMKDYMARSDAIGLAGMAKRG